MHSRIQESTTERGTSFHPVISSKSSVQSRALINRTMGNCAFKGNAEASAARRSAIVRVATHNGGVMELCPPVTAECVTNGFPGHGVYRGHEKFARPLLHNEELAAGELYYLRPVNRAAPSTANVAPYRVSFDQHRFRGRNEEEASEGGVKCANRIGMWKVRLVISPAQLAEILSHESRTEALIESVRTVAKCGNGSAAGSSVASSDQWSLASSRKAASESTIG